MMKITKRITLFLGVIALLSSCRVFDPSVMLRTKRDYPYATASDTMPREYIIQTGDVITFLLFSNQGFKQLVKIKVDNLSHSLSIRLSMKSLIIFRLQNIKIKISLWSFGQITQKIFLYQEQTFKLGSQRMTVTICIKNGIWKNTLIFLTMTQQNGLIQG